MRFIFKVTLYHWNDTSKIRLFQSHLINHRGTERKDYKAEGEFE